MIKRLIFILLLFSGIIVKGQEFDDLIYKLELYAYTDYEKMQEVSSEALKLAGTNKAKKARVYLEYANHYYYQGNYAKADSVFGVVARMAKEGGDIYLRNKAVHRQTVIMSETGQHREAEKIFRKQIIEFEKQKDYENLVDAYNGLAQIKLDHDMKRDSGLYFYNQALLTAREINSEYQQAYLLNNIGLLKMDMGNMEEALEDFKSAYNYSSNTKKIRLQAHIANNIGLIYMRKDEYDKSEKYFRDFMAHAKKAGAGKEIGIAYMNLGTIYYLNEDYEMSKQYYDSSLYHLDRIGAKLFLARALNTISQNKIIHGDYEGAILYADSAINMAMRHELMEDYIMAHKLLARTYDSLGNYQEAIRYYKLVQDHSDSIQKLKYDKTVADMAVKYGLQEKENELKYEQSRNELLEKKRKLDEIQRSVIIAGGGFLIILVVIIMYLRHVRVTRKKQREYSKQLLQNLENERNRIAKELHDDLGQRLSMIRNQIEVKESLDKEALERMGENLETAVENTRNMARTLYPSYLRKVDLKSAISTLLDTTEDNTGITCSYSIELNGSMIGDHTKLHIYRIIQECISNTVKHAGASAIKVSLNNENGNLRLEYRDNGKGVHKKAEMSGMGMMSINERVRILNGDINVSRGKGFKLAITFKPNGNTDSR